RRKLRVCSLSSSATTHLGFRLLVGGLQAQNLVHPVLGAFHVLESARMLKVQNVVTESRNLHNHLHVATFQRNDGVIEIDHIVAPPRNLGSGRVGCILHAVHIIPVIGGETLGVVHYCSFRWTSYLPLVM